MTVQERLQLIAALIVDKIAEDKDGIQQSLPEQAEAQNA